MNRVIIESPYAGDIERNTAYARRCMRHSLDQGEAPFASHLLYTQPNVLDDTVERERDQGIQAGYEWMHASDKVAFYVDLGWSRGMLRALKMARILKKPIAVRMLYRDRVMIQQSEEVTQLLQDAGTVEYIGPLGPGRRNVQIQAMTKIADALANFKAYVAAIEYHSALAPDDTLALDRALAEASRLLYDTRHAIDLVWLQAREISRPRTIYSGPRDAKFLDLFSDEEIAEALAVVRAQKESK